LLLTDTAQFIAELTRNSGRRRKMRSICLAAIAGLFLTQAAQAADVVVLVPPVVAAAGLRNLTDAYAKETGEGVTVKMALMSKILPEAETGMPAADAVALPGDLMVQLEHDKGIQPGSRKSIGRAEIALAVPAGAPHPEYQHPRSLSPY
jgi:ABC-type molybdate transport system substrate-binding protein